MIRPNLYRNLSKKEEIIKFRLIKSLADRYQVQFIREIYGLSNAELENHRRPRIQIEEFNESPENQIHAKYPDGILRHIDLLDTIIP